MAELFGLTEGLLWAVIVVAVLLLVGVLGFAVGGMVTGDKRGVMGVAGVGARLGRPRGENYIDIRSAENSRPPEGMLSGQLDIYPQPLERMSPSIYSTGGPDGIHDTPSQRSTAAFGRNSTIMSYSEPTTMVHSRSPTHITSGATQNW